MKILTKTTMFLWSMASAIAPAAVARRLYEMTAKTRRGEPSAEERQFFETARANLISWEAGRNVVAYEWGEGPVAVFQHGWNGRASQFHQMAQLLLSLRYKVVLLDAPGHGRSAGDSSDLREMASALEALCNRYPAIALMVGHSAGCLAVAHCVGRGVAAEQVVLISPPCSVDNVMRRQLEKIPVSSESKRIVVRLSKQRLGVSTWDSLDFKRLAPLFPPQSRVLIVHDKDDREVPFSDAQAVAAALAGAQLTMTEQLGHRKILRSDRMLDIVADFLGRTPLQRPAQGAAG